MALLRLDLTHHPNLPHSHELFDNVASGHRVDDIILGPKTALGSLNGDAVGRDEDDPQQRANDELVAASGEGQLEMDTEQTLGYAPRYTDAQRVERGKEARLVLRVSVLSKRDEVSMSSRILHVHQIDCRGTPTHQLVLDASNASLVVADILLH